MGVFFNGQQIGAVAPGAVALGRQRLTIATAGLQRGALTASPASVALAAGAVPVAPTFQKASPGSDAPASSGGVSRTVMIGAGVAGALVLGLVAFKLTR